MYGKDWLQGNGVGKSAMFDWLLLSVFVGQMWARSGRLDLRRADKLSGLALGRGGGGESELLGRLFLKLEAKWKRNLESDMAADSWELEKIG